MLVYFDTETSPVVISWDHHFAKICLIIFVVTGKMMEIDTNVNNFINYLSGKRAAVCLQCH